MATFSYAGVYIEEVPSGVHTITGVATSIAAFVGWANMGPTDHAVLVQSWSEFANQFGGVTNNGGQPNYLGYAVNQFFNNGGSQAYIIRLVANATVVAANPSDKAAGLIGSSKQVSKVPYFTRLAFSQTGNLPRLSLHFDWEVGLAYGTANSYSPQSRLFSSTLPAPV